MDAPLRRYRLAGVVATAVLVLSVPLYLAVRSLRPPRTAPPLRASKSVKRKS